MEKSKKYPSIQKMSMYGDVYYVSDDVAGRAFSTREELIETFNKEQNGKS